jgi:hypothetical protein
MRPSTEKGAHASKIAKHSGLLGLKSGVSLIFGGKFGAKGPPSKSTSDLLGSNPTGERGASALIEAI